MNVTKNLGLNLRARSSGANCPVQAAVRVLVAMFAAIVMYGAESAWALPAGFGTGCSLSGSTLAESGNPGVLSPNVQSLSGGCGSRQATSNGLVQVPVVTDVGPNLFNFSQAATTAAAATAGMGTLGASSGSHATSMPQSYLYTLPHAPGEIGDGGITENEYRAKANSSATSQWWDGFTVGGTGNDAGFVVLQFTLDLHGQSSASPQGAASASFLSRLFINDFSRFNGQILELPTQGTVSTTIGFRTFSSFQIYGDLMASTDVLAGRQYTNACNPFFCTPVRGDYFPESDAIANAANTAGFHIDIVTAGGSYTTLSGQNYITAVPEPTAAWLFGFGLPGVIGVIWRRRLPGAARPIS